MLSPSGIAAQLRSLNLLNCSNHLYFNYLKWGNCVSDEKDTVCNCFYSKLLHIRKLSKAYSLNDRVFGQQIFCNVEDGQYWMQGHVLLQQSSCFCRTSCTLHSLLIIILILFKYKLIRIRQYDKLSSLHLSAI